MSGRHISDVQFARIAEKGGWRWWLLLTVLYASEAASWLPVLTTRGRLEALRNKADGYDIAVDAWEHRGREIGRLREVVRVNGLRWGHTHGEIDKILDRAASPTPAAGAAA